MALRSPIDTPHPKWSGHHRPLSYPPRRLRERAGVRGAQQKGMSVIALSSQPDALTALATRWECWAKCSLDGPI